MSTIHLLPPPVYFFLMFKNSAQESIPSGSIATPTPLPLSHITDSCTHRSAQVIPVVIPCYLVHLHLCTLRFLMAQTGNYFKERNILDIQFLVLNGAIYWRGWIEHTYHHKDDGGCEMRYLLSKYLWSTYNVPSARHTRVNKSVMIPLVGNVGF